PWYFFVRPVSSTAACSRGEACLHLAPKLQGTRDHAEGLAGAARARHGDRSVTQDAAEDPLVDADPLDLLQQELERMAADQPDLDEHSLVGDGKLRADRADPRRHQQNQTDQP